MLFFRKVYIQARAIIAMPPDTTNADPALMMTSDFLKLSWNNLIPKTDISKVNKKTQRGLVPNKALTLDTGPVETAINNMTFPDMGPIVSVEKIMAAFFRFDNKLPKLCIEEIRMYGNPMVEKSPIPLKAILCHTPNSVDDCLSSTCAPPINIAPTITSNNGKLNSLLGSVLPKLVLRKAAPKTTRNIAIHPYTLSDSPRK